MIGNVVDFNDVKETVVLGEEHLSPMYDKIQGYGKAIQKVHAVAESNGINGTTFGFVMSNPTMSKKLFDAYASPLVAESIATNNGINSGIGGGLNDGVMVTKADLIAEDQKFIDSRYEYTRKLFAASYLTGDLTPMEQAMLPLQFLGTIACNARFVVDHKVAPKYTFRRKTERRFFKVGSDKYYLPDALKDNTIMNAVNGHSQKNLDIVVTPADIVAGKVNLLELASVLVPGLDPASNSLMPEIILSKAVTTVGAKELIVKEDTKNNVITQHVGGKMFVTILDQTQDPVSGAITTNATYRVAGEVNFSTGDVFLTIPTGLDSVSFKVVIDGAPMRRVISVGTETTPLDFTLKQRLNMAISYDPVSLENYVQIEQQDGLLKLSSIMLEVATHSKDSYAFNFIEDIKTDLKKADATLKKYATGAGTPNDWFEGTFSYEPPVASNYRPTDPIQWREKTLPEEIRKVLVEFDKKFNSGKGIVNVMYADFKTASKIPNLVVVIEQNTEYAGVNVDFGIFNLRINDKFGRVVSTERARSVDEITLVPRSNNENQETITFYQSFSRMYKDGSIRDAANPLLPALAYIDVYDMVAIHRILGAIYMA
jgi:hypothetical protein